MRIIKCYYYLEGDEENDDGVIRALCLNCHDKSFPLLGMAYEGFCGPWETKCGKCGTIILPKCESPDQT